MKEFFEPLIKRIDAILVKIKKFLKAHPLFVRQVINPVVAVIGVLIVIKIASGGCGGSSEEVIISAEPTTTTTAASSTTTSVPAIDTTTTTITTTTFTTTTTVATKTEDIDFDEPVLPQKLDHDSIISFLEDVVEYNIPGNAKLMQVTLEDRNIDVIVDATHLGENDTFPAYIQAEVYVPNLADEILNYSELRPYWDTITVEFVPFRPIVFSKEYIYSYDYEGYTITYFDYPEEYYDFG